MPPTTLNLIGPGRAGADVCAALVAGGDVRALGVMGRDAGRAAQVAERLGAAAHGELSQLAPSALWIVAVPDDAIAAVSTSLADTGLVGSDSTVLHLSGHLPAGALDARLRRRGAVHPVRSFQGRDDDALRDVYCAVDGDVDDDVVGLFEAVGARVFRVSADAKARYHLGCSVAGNFSVTLLAWAEKLFTSAELEPAFSRALAVSLMQSAMRSSAERGPADALTGPLVRGDTSTVKGHAAALAADEVPLYRALAQATLNMAVDAGRLPPEKAAEIAKLLDIE